MSQMCRTKTLSMPRQRAAKLLRVFYVLMDDGNIRFLDGSDITLHLEADGTPYLRIRVDVDKNLQRGSERFAYIPAEITALGISPVKLVLDYLRIVRPPSGSFLLSALKGTKTRTFYSNPFTGIHRRRWGKSRRKSHPSRSPERTPNSWSRFCHSESLGRNSRWRP